jgi:hypothetical protein
VILPTKRISADRALLGIGARVLRQLRRPQTVSHLWDAVKKDGDSEVTYDWFVLALDLLYVIRAVELEDGRIRRAFP